MNYIPWDGWIALALLLVGMGAGSFIYGAILWQTHQKEFSRATTLGWYATPILTALGMFILLVDLGRPERFINTLLNFNPHSILNMGVFLQSFFVALAFAVASGFFLKKEQSKHFDKLIFATLALAIGVGIYHGLLPFSMGREGWNGVMIFVMFFSSLLSGRALIELLSPNPNTSKSIDTLIATSFWIVLAMWFYSLSIGSVSEQKVLTFLFEEWSYSTLFITLLILSFVVSWSVLVNPWLHQKFRIVAVSIEFMGAFMLKLGIIFGGQISFMGGA